ncbi:MAG: hypothetical protein LUG95_07195 [Clostridiales bacterium]|nr:hypothetical protein [Clostridiales bacterium]
MSESGHSAIFHDLAGRYSGACSQLTGVVHIGIAVGIFIAFFKLFSGLFKNFFASWNDLFHKRLSIKNASSQRKFMFMTLLSFAFMILYAIPTGKSGSLFELFRSTSYNGNILGEGICLALTGVLIIVSAFAVSKKSSSSSGILHAVVIGIVAFLTLPFAGCSFVFGIYAAALILGMSEKYALRYSMVMSVPVLLVAGVVEICTAVTQIGVVSAIIAAIVSAAASFFFIKLFIFIVRKKALKYFAYYDIAIGVISVVIGAVELAAK